MTFAENILNAAAYYAKSGIAVFPLEPKKKKPFLAGGFQIATRDATQIKAWWKKRPSANIGIPCGKINGFIAMDADKNHHDGEDGEETIRALEKVLGPLPDTKAVLTPNGGTHYLYKCPESFDVKNYGSKRADDKKRDVYKGVEIVGLDIRGNGGYIVAPPSVIEKNGGGIASYEWDAVSFDADIAELPAAWLEFIKAIEAPDASGAEQTSAQEWNGEGFDIIADVLPFVDVTSCNYEDWTRVGMALKNLGYSIDVWDKWSSTDTTNGSDGKPRYIPGECARKWKTFRTKGNGQNLGGRFLINLAKANGLKTAPPAPVAPFHVEQAEARRHNTRKIDPTAVSRLNTSFDMLEGQGEIEPEAAHVMTATATADMGNTMPPDAAPAAPAYMVQQPEAQRKPEPINTQRDGAAAPAADVNLRNHPAYRYGASMRAQSWPEAKIHERLISFNQNDCGEPLTAEEVETVFQLLLTFPAGTKLAQMLPDGGRKGKDRLQIENLSAELEARDYKVQYNCILSDYEVIGKTETGRNMSLDDLRVIMQDALADTYTGVTRSNLEDFISYIARENEYNPVLETLQGVEWDGRDRLPQLYDLIGIEADELSKTLVYKWLLQTIALLFNDKADPFGANGVLVLNSKELVIEENQGAGKTSLCRHLALRDAWFGEGMSVNDRDKDTTRRIVTTWIAELGEVECTMKSDISALKAFVSAAIDKYRLPYGRSDIVAPRMTSLCATCNSDRYLIDQTGNRRWWTVPVKRVMPYSEIKSFDALQLWAQIYAEVAPLSYPEKSACFRLTGDELAALAKRNGDYEKPMKGQPEIEDILARAERDKLPTKTLTASDWKEYWPVLRPYDSRQIGAALKKCGIDTTLRKVNGTSGRFAELPIPRNTY